MSELNKGALSPKTPSMPFMLGPYKGEATVRYSANRGVEDSGFTAIGREFTDEMVKGFPVMRAAVTFSGKGHEAMFGWAQAVSHIHGDGVEKRFTVDLAPSVQGNDFPCCAVGYKPSTFDAPCNRPRTDMAWRAYTFLFRFISQPRRESSRRVYPIVGFMRGYVLSDRGKKVAVTELREMGASEWERIFPRCLRKLPRRYAMAKKDPLSAEWAPGSQAWDTPATPVYRPTPSPERSPLAGVGCQTASTRARPLSRRVSSHRLPKKGFATALRERRQAAVACLAQSG
ncbi:MAG: hypothetical protein JRN28_04390 [Nitrososphaerota archaeon]|nr:hypothetical protein [Nitrososphaerota archaeon]